MSPTPVFSRPYRPGARTIRKRSCNFVECDVVIPYCRVDVQWLSEAVESIRRQQFARCVIHLINDGVSEQDDLGAQYAGITDIHRYRNTDPVCVGPYVSLMRVFDRLETDYIVVQDCDDIALPDRCYCSIAELLQKRADIWGGAMTQFVDLDSIDDELLGKQLNKGPYIQSTPNFVVNCTMTVTRHFFDDLNGFPDWKVGSDCEFINRAIAAKAEFCISQKIVGLRRLHSQSLTHQEVGGFGSAERELLNEERKRRQALWKDTRFEPRIFGSLDAVRRDSHLTVKL